MKALPVVERELRASARRGSTYWLRVGAAAALLAGFGLGVADQSGSATELGRRLFITMNRVLFLAIGLLTPLLTADAISRERREGTLGLLFLTPLTAGAVVCGKGLCDLLRAGSMWLAGVPILAIPFLLGGVAWFEAVYAGCLNASLVLLGLSSGLAASACSRAWGRALLLAVVLSVLMGAGLLVVSGWLWGAELAVLIPGMWFRPAGHWGMGSSFGLGLQVLLGSGPWMVWPGMMPAGVVGAVPGVQVRLGLEVLGGAVGVTVLVLGWTAWWTGRVWRDRPAGRLQLWWERQFLRPRVARGVLRRSLRRMLERNPVGWLHQYSTSSRVVKWGWGLFAVCGESLLVTEFNWYELFQVQTGFLVVLLVALAASAAGSFRKEREAGAFELILVTPLRESQVIWGRLRGLWEQFLPAMGIVLGAAIFLVKTRMGDAHMRRDVWLRWSELAEVMAFGVAYLSLPAVGLWYSLVKRNFVVAWLWTLAAGLVAPLVAAVAMWFVLGWVELWRLWGRAGAVYPGGEMGVWFFALFAGGLMVSAGVHGWLLRRHLGRREFLALSA